ncbi:hypothetical protein BG011_000831 [Mortierella polycephala]|uniref:Uncharacterized protein n=1 Tax=Mortierella polycephala TaxID=41804 RepID=A0A9P6PHP7_9FUNG|nr:hypothetical protein BG011_000831 [Mortierella polycephala]
MATRDHIEWALSAGNASMRSFAEKFNYTDRRTAEEAYLLLINSNEIAKPRREQLLLGFETFKANAADVFWVKRYTAIQTVVITKKAAVDSMQAGHQQSTYEYQQHFAREERQSSAAVGVREPTTAETHGNGCATTSTAPVFDSAGKHSLEENGISPPAKKQKDKKANFVLCSPIHSFMIDLSDKTTRQLFSKDDWTEISSDLPHIPPYSKEASEYLDKFDSVATLEDLQDLLDRRPRDTESQLIYECLLNWLCLYETEDPSPFNVAGSLSEGWWLKSAWGVCTNMALGMPGCFIIPGEITGHDSSARRNKDRESAIGSERKRVGVRADLIWRNMKLPETDWAIAEAAKVWCPNSNKYISESKFKLPRQLHDVLVGRSMEVGGASELRNAFVSGTMSPVDWALLGSIWGKCYKIGEDGGDEARSKGHQPLGFASSHSRSALLQVLMDVDINHPVDIGIRTGRKATYRQEEAGPAFSPDWRLVGAEELMAGPSSVFPIVLASSLDRSHR